MRKPFNFLSLFLFTAILTACGTPQSSPEPSNLGGLALYTVRDTMSVAPKAVLQEVHDVGYAYVEAAGYQDGMFYGMAPTDFKAYMESIGLRPMSTHMGMLNWDNMDQLMTDTKAAGFTYFVVPVPPMGMFTYDNEAQKMGMEGDLDEMIALLNEAGEKADESGLQLLYHNHDFEFEANEDGIVPIDYMLENTDPEFVNFQMDLYWVTKAGADPMEYFENYPGRFKSWHVKDMDEQGRFAPVGNGTIDFAAILENKDTSGMVHYFVEQDQTYSYAPMEAIRISHSAIDSIGFD